jgi:hypothetical protein
MADEPAFFGDIFPLTNHCRHAAMFAGPSLFIPEG